MNFNWSSAFIRTIAVVRSPIYKSSFGKKFIHKLKLTVPSIECTHTVFLSAWKMRVELGGAKAFFLCNAMVFSSFLLWSCLCSFRFPWKKYEKSTLVHITEKNYGMSKKRENQGCFYIRLSLCWWEIGFGFGGVSSMLGIFPLFHQLAIFLLAFNCIIF